MTAPVPEYTDAPAPSNAANMTAADARAISGSVKPLDLSAMLTALKAPRGIPANVPQITGNGAGNGVDLGSAVKKIIDFVETPFYMLTNSVDSHFEREDNGSEANSLGSYLDDARQGIQRGIEGGIGNNPTYTKDWIDVIKHAQKGTPDEGNDTAANWVGGISDLVLDPLNMVPGAGIAKGVLKAPGVVAGALRDTSKLAATKIAKGAEDVAAHTAEPIALGAGKAAEAPAVVSGTEGATEATKAPVAVTAPPTATPTPEAAAANFKSIPEIANVLKAQDTGPVKNVLNALGQNFKDTYAASDVNKVVQGFKEGFSGAEKKAFLKPIPVNPENILQAHLEGVADKDELAKEPVATMAAPDTIKTPTEPAAKVPEAMVDKQADLIGSAANSTLAKKAWENMSADDKQATRVAEAHRRLTALDEPIQMTPQVVDKTKAAQQGKLNKKGTSIPAYITPEDQKQMVMDAVDDTRAYQTGKDLVNPVVNKDGYIIPAGRGRGTAAAEAGGIRHPMLYDTHAQFRPFQSILNGENGIKGIDEMLSYTGRKTSSFIKPEIITKATKAVDAQLEASGMIPVLNLSKYADKDGYIHLTQGDILEASLAKSVPGIDTATTFTKGDILKHIIGAKPVNHVNPMALNTAMETLLHVRKAIFNKIKESGAAMLPDDLEKLLNKAQQNIKDVLMGERKAYGPQATKEDLANIRATIDSAITARGKSGAETYEEDMDKLAHKIIRDPHLGTMLEQRHLYNQAMHSANLEKFTNHNWDDIRTRLLSMAAGPASYEQVMHWYSKLTRDTRNLLPAPARAQYEDWIKQLKETIISPAEEKAVNAVDSRSTIVDSGKAAEDALKATGEPYSAIDLHAGKIAADVLRAIHPVRAFFDQKFPYLATSDFYPEVMRGKYAIARMQSQAHQFLTQWIMKHNKDGQLLDSVKSILTAAVEKTPVLDPATRELKAGLGVLFNGDTRYMKAIKAGTLNKDFLEQVLKSDKYKGLFDRIDTRWWAGANQDNLHEFLQHMHITDSAQAADTISKLYSAVLDINSRVGMARSFEKEFGSSVAKEGYSKIRWEVGRKQINGISKVGQRPRSGAEGSGFFDLLDKNLHYDKAAAWEIPSIHRLINESRMVSNENLLGRFVNNVFDPMTQVIKATQTTLRPGHWTSNVMGDTIRNFLAGVRDPRSYAYNMRVMSATARDEKLFSQGIGRFERSTLIARGEYGRRIPASERKHMIPISEKGNVKYYTATEIGRRFQDHGIFIPPHGIGQHEDLIAHDEQAVTSKLAGKAVKATDALLSNKYYDLNKWGAVRDGLTRGALAMDVLIHGDHESLDAAMKAAAAKVRKWAPMSSDFTREESVYARRAILYYTWIRGMIPNVIETMVEKPGMFLAPNRALYAQAKANGVDPMSIGNPFPINAMFPKYYYDNLIGPQFKTDGGQLWGYSPMAPSIDVLDTLFNNNNVIGALNPMAKIPIEMATGQSNGIPIKDNAQYLQDNILPPQLDMISKATGKELYTGLQQNRTDKGNSQPVPGTGIPADVMNFFTGLHATDYNSPADIRSVVAENKVNKSNARADIQRNNR